MKNSLLTLIAFVMTAGVGFTFEGEGKKEVEFQAVMEVVKRYSVEKLAEPRMVAEDVHVMFRVGEMKVLDGGGCRDCEAYPLLLIAERKEGEAGFSAVIINEAAVAMERLDVKSKGRVVKLTGKLTVYPKSEGKAGGNYELFVDEVRRMRVVAE